MATIDSLDLDPNSPYNNPNDPRYAESQREREQAAWAQPATAPAPVPPAPPRQAPIPQSEWSQPGWKNPLLYGGDTGRPVPGALQMPAGPANGDWQGWFRSLVQGKPFGQQTLLDLEPTLKQYGARLEPKNAMGEQTKIRLPDNSVVRVGFGSGNWEWVNQPGPGAEGQMPGYGQTSGYGSQFSDPATQQLEAYLMAQMQALAGQRQQQEVAQGAFKQRQAQAQEATDRLTKFMQERAARLQGPAYTGTEQEILRTQALDPLERDRQAAKQRALQNIGARGMDPTSGIAQELLNQVDRAFDQQRATTQGEIGYRQVQEQRSREQEAQSLLGYIPQAQRAANAGDLEFLQALDAAVNRPAEAQLPLSSMLYQLPRNALQDALAAMGMGGTAPTSNDLFNQAMSLYQTQQQQRGQSAQRYGAIFQALPYLLGGSHGGY